jgi:hypothetical protein
VTETKQDKEWKKARYRQGSKKERIGEIYVNKLINVLK